MTRQKNTQTNDSVWRFRREITAGALVQLAAILIMLVAGWSNLQKELSLIRHDLDQLIRENGRLQKHIENLASQEQEHEYRLKRLEEDIQRG